MKDDQSFQKDSDFDLKDFLSQTPIKNEIYKDYSFWFSVKLHPFESSSSIEVNTQFGHSNNIIPKKMSKNKALEIVKVIGENFIVNEVEIRWVFCSIKIA